MSGSFFKGMAAGSSSVTMAAGYSFMAMPVSMKPGSHFEAFLPCEKFDLPFEELAIYEKSDSL